jgi:hypothetical protein
MRAILCLAVVLLFTSSAPGAPQKKKKQEKPDPNPAIERVAHEVFKNNDRNHNNALSRTELHTADKEVQTRLLQLARQGVLGAAKSKEVEVSVAPGGEKNLEKSNTITQGEFTAHVQSMAQQVDAAAREQNKALAAAKQKYNAAKKAAAKKRASYKRKK